MSSPAQKQFKRVFPATASAIVHSPAPASAALAWDECDSDDVHLPALNSAPPTSAQLSVLTAVPAAMHRGVKGGKRSKSSFKEKHAAVTESTVPWLRRPLINHAITVVEGVAPVTAFTSSNTLPVFGAFWVELSQLANYTSFATVFDEYCIMEVEALITPSATESSTGNSYGQYTTAIDEDDSNVPTSTAALLNYESAITTNTDVAHYHRWKPQFSVATYSGTFTSYSPSSGWVDIASPTVRHYGLKFGQTIAGVTQTPVIQFRLKVGFRRVR